MAKSRIHRDYQDTKECRLSMAKTKFHDQSFVMYMQKNSPINKDINMQYDTIEMTSSEYYCKRLLSLSLFLSSQDDAPSRIGSHDSGGAAISFVKQPVRCQRESSPENAPLEAGRFVGSVFVVGCGRARRAGGLHIRTN